MRRRGNEAVELTLVPLLQLLLIKMSRLLKLSELLLREFRLSRWSDKGQRGRSLSNSQDAMTSIQETGVPFQHRANTERGP